MDEQHESVEGNNDRGVRSSIKKLKKRVAPGLKYALSFYAVLNFAMLVVGCLNVHKCPVNKEIPVFLIATGAIGLVSKFVSYIRDRLAALPQVNYVKCVESALYSVETIFFFLGTYWVYKEFQPSYDPNDNKSYCNKTAYLFAFTYITFFYAVAIATLLGFCCILGCAIWLEQTQTYDVENQRDATETTTALTHKNENEAK